MTLPTAPACRNAGTGPGIPTCWPARRSRWRRLLAIADACDVLTSLAMQPPHTVHAWAGDRRLEDSAGGQSDPALVTIFIEAVDPRALRRSGSSGQRLPVRGGKWD